MYDIFLSAAIFSSSMGAFKFFLWLLLSSLDKAFASPKKKAKICLAEAVWASPSAEDQLKNQEELVEEIESLHRRNQLPATKVVKMLTKAGGLRVKAPTSQSLNKANEDAALGGNAARSMRRWLKKNNTWCQLYWANIPLKNPKTQEISPKPLPFLLPHEWLEGYLMQPGAWQDCMPERGSMLATKLAQCCADCGEPAQGMVPLGIHGDGVPVQGRMNQSSLDFITVNLLASRHSQLRVPLTCVDAKFIAGPETTQATLEVLAWSLQHLVLGMQPALRHDGAPFEEPFRLTRIGKSLCKAVVVMMRGDWDWNVKWYGCPMHNVKVGMCWLCSCKPTEWRCQTLDQRKSQSLDKAQFLASLELRKKAIAPLFHVNPITNHTIVPDWMHVMDEGCGAACAGQVLNALLPCYEGKKQEKASRLWAHIQTIYSELGVPASEQLPKLTLLDIVKPGKAPELDTKAATCRYFCRQGILSTLTSAHNFDTGTSLQKAIHKVATFTTQVYQHMEAFNGRKLAKYGRALKSQYMALESHIQREDENDVCSWHAKPKWHLAEHIFDLAWEGHNPKDFWNYRDETFASSMQQWALRRGGKRNASSEAEKILLCFMNDTPPLSVNLPSSA